MSYIDYQKESAWKVVYTDFTGITKRAVELISAELGEEVTRSTGGIFSPCFALGKGNGKYRARS